MDKTQSYDELNTYFIINEIDGFIWKMRHDMANNRIPKESHEAINKDIEKLTKVQQYAVSTLTRFGVSNPYRNEQRHPSAEYRAWFRWWDHYIRQMPENDWKALEQKCASKEDVSSYRPTGNWKDRIIHEEEALKKADKLAESLETC
jgi:hypothetical protein